MLHELLKTWFVWVEQWGYWGIFILMAMESSIVPVPSEIIMPPAAFWAAQGRFNFTAVVLAGTFGSLFGSLTSYFVAQVIGEPFLKKYGKLVLITEKKQAQAQAFVLQHGVAGVFFARLLPVFRHLVSIPAGILRMSLGKFSIATALGAAIWCWVLAFFGEKILGAHPELLQSPEEMMTVIKGQMHWVLIAVVGLVISYSATQWLLRRKPVTTDPR